MRYPVNHISISQGHHYGKCLDFGWWKQEYRGQNVMACDNGVVYRVEWQELGGNVVYIKHDNGIISGYNHLDKVCVKKGQRVTIGQIIGTMGETGKGITGMHTHFALYSKGKNIWGHSDLDPFALCEVYPDQEVRTTGTTAQYLNRFKYHDKPTKWTTGVYQLLKSKAVRKEPKITNNIKKVKECMSWAPVARAKLTTTKLNKDAYLKAGCEIDIVQIINENGRIWGKWGKTGNDYVVLCNIDGTPQATKVK